MAWVRGRVSSKDDKGIHGITVRLAGNEPGTETLSHADGAFELPLPDQQPANAKLEFVDRDGKLLRRQSLPTSEKPLQVKLVEGKLAGHLSRPTSLSRFTGRLLPKERLDVLTQFIGRLPEARRAQYAMLVGDRPCPFPALDQFEDLLDDVWGTIGGDLFARGRFEDVIDSLVAGQVQKPPQPALASVQSKLSPEAVINRIADELKVSAKRWAPVERLIGRDSLLPVLVATAYVYGDKGPTLDRALRAVLGHLDAYRGVASLLSAAEGALTGGQSGQRHALAIFGLFDDLCGLGEDLPPSFGGIDIDPGDLGRIEHWGCTAEAALALARIRDAIGFPPSVPASTATYRIDRQDPVRTCAGNTITLHGVGFTDEPGLVRFSGSLARRRIPIDMVATSWTDTEIVVEVPEIAACGLLELRIVEQRLTVSVCDAFVDFSTYREAETPFEFEGCRPRIAFFGLSDVSGCATVGSDSLVSWRVEPEDAEISVEVREGSGDWTTIADIDLRRSVAVDTTRVATYEYRLTVHNPRSNCGTDTERVTVNVLPPPPTLEIRGVELTQGIQRFSFTDPAANNTVPMIANMDTIVRVFVASDRGAFDAAARVSGRLYCGGWLYRPANGSPRGSAPIITAGASPDRRNTDDSLNFLIPAGRANGAETLRIEVFPVDRCDGDEVVSTSMPIVWIEREPYPVTIRRIADPGTGNVITEDEAWTLVEDAFGRLPSPRTAIRMREGVFTIHVGTTEANYCRDGGFYQLALSVAYEHNGVEGFAPDPHETAWLGIFFARGCPVSGMMSWPWTSTCISERNLETVAHELAHTAGMGHTVTPAGERCEDVSQPVACHRLPNGGLLVDVAFDIRNNVTLPDCADLMSCRAEVRFFHPDHWERCRDLMDGRF